MKRIYMKVLHGGSYQNYKIEKPENAIRDVINHTKAITYYGITRSTIGDKIKLTNKLSSFLKRKETIFFIGYRKEENSRDLFPLS